ncbi:uncharacterized protein LOC143769833 [Ranitomeya variabilis]|uniref:uncharacterized protein LOC143769833 n=1 Tax=Ranitomeya variabilis TaxID=490064 RepID=UPI0040568721
MTRKNWNTIYPAEINIQYGSSKYVMSNSYTGHSSIRMLLSILFQKPLRKLYHLLTTDSGHSARLRPLSKTPATQQDSGHSARLRPLSKTPATQQDSGHSARLRPLSKTPATQQDSGHSARLRPLSKTPATQQDSGHSAINIFKIFGFTFFFSSFSYTINQNPIKIAVSNQV